MARGRYVGKGALLGYGAKVQVHSVTSTATVLPNWGMVSFGATGAKTWRMKDPEPGQSVTLFCNDASGTALQTVKTSSTRNFVGPNASQTALVFDQDNQSITLMGRTTANYEILARDVNGVTTVTSTAVKLPTHGIVAFGSTAAKSFRLAQPRPGDEFVLYMNIASTTIRKVVASTGTAVQFATTAGLKNVAQFNQRYETLWCKAVSTAVIVIEANATIAYSTA